MDKERILGAAQTVKGHVEEVAGKILGDKKLEGQGKVDAAAGAIRNAVGGAKDTVVEVVKDATKK